MIKVHHLAFSRSTRILWLLEELEQPYEIVAYARDPQTIRAPEALAAAHPLGKAPVIEDGELTLAESGAVVEYLIERYGHGRLAPEGRGAAWASYIEWLHYAEGSAMMPLLMTLLGGMTGGLPPGLKGFLEPEVRKHLDYVASAVTDGGYLLGDLFSGADIQMFYVLEVGRMGRMLGGHPALEAYLQRLHARPAFARALERGGPVTLPLG